MSKWLLKRRKIHLRQMKKFQRTKIYKLLLAGLPTIVFGVFTVIFTLQQDKSAKAARQQDQQQADENNRRTLFKEYIDDMTTLLTNVHENTNISEILLHIRVQTLTVLPNLDAGRKRDVIVFLYENRLLRSDITRKVDLHGANLNGVQFWSSSTVSCRLPFLYLPGTYLENALFHRCQLEKAVFDHASMVSTKFLTCQMKATSFVETNLTAAHFQGNQLENTNFAGSYLGQSSITGGIFQKIELTNADLYQSDISDELLHPRRNADKRSHTFLNTRYPNGSFVCMNRQNLMMKGDSKALCKNHRRLFQTDSSLRSSYDDELSIVNGVCFNLTWSNKGTITTSDLRQFSLLIDLEQAMFNLSTFIGLKKLNDEDKIIITVLFYQDEDINDDDRSIVISKTNVPFFQFELLQYPIPAKTRRLIIWPSCEIISDRNQFCIFDQIKLSVFEKTLSKS